MDREIFRFRDLLMAMLDLSDDSDSDYVPSSSESDSDSEDDTVPSRLVRGAWGRRRRSGSRGP